ncbi:MAG: MazG nucleotide pyrophosphohydrolase domain-containing protein [Lachnospiraceae bacterium]|nr:MazG nucleotide pyrophosphohydrolase domain-containing protein [Lachnospiraceae bacterium]
MSFEEFREIVGRLRGEDGCPWDKAQTFESLKPCMIDEMTEALAGIDIYRETGDAGNLCEELGDVLLQVVLMAQIAEEAGLFTIDDVIRGIGEKMVRRHPHVFAGQSVKDREAQLQQWEEIKSREKQGQNAKQKDKEKAAFSQASKQVREHLEKKLKRS